MGQKIHPGGMRVGVIHDWKSNWYTGPKEFAGVPARGHPDPRAHLQEAVARGAVGHPDPQGQAADHGRHLHRAPRHRHRQVGRRGRRAPQRAACDHAEERPHQHQRDQAPRARREARRAVDRRAAVEPRRVPPRDEARARVGDPLRRGRREDPVLGPPRRRRDEPARDLQRGTRAAAHDPRRHRLRLRRGEDDVRPHRREGLDQQGRDHAGGLRGRQHRRPAPRRPGRAAPPRRGDRGSRRLPRERPRARPRPRGPRPGASAAAVPAAVAAAQAAAEVAAPAARGPGGSGGRGRGPAAGARPAAGGRPARRSRAQRRQAEAERAGSRDADDGRSR